MATKVPYTVVIERAPGNFSAYVPDLPGCVATGATEDEVLKEITEAIRFHFEGMIKDGHPIPPPQSTSHMVEIELKIE